MKFRGENGITMIALVITVVVLLIIVGIGLGSGEETIKNTQLENLKTNMLLMKAKTKGYVENANYDLGTNIDTAKDEIKTQREEKSKSELKGTEIVDTTILKQVGISQEEIETASSKRIYYYQLSTQDLEEMGLKNVTSDEESGFYLVKYDVNEMLVEIYHTKGIKKGNKIVYSLTQLNE